MLWNRYRGSRKILFKRRLLRSSCNQSVNDLTSPVTAPGAAPSTKAIAELLKAALAF
jgi:hypothetical protein